MADTLTRQPKPNSQSWRFIIQISFILLCLWIGIEFYWFMQWGTSNGQIAFSPRPPGVEGFLPVSSLISLVYWIETGIINTVHPAGLFIFLAILTIGILFKKSFCSWLCPIGTLSEFLWRLGKRIIASNLRPPGWLDYPLRSLKYLLLFFFLWTIGQMSFFILHAFIYSPYNKVADIKMYFFFAHITPIALWTLIFLVVFSILIKNFWCRYLCPYGALLGILSFLSPLRIRRNKAACVGCRLCTKACPSDIKVHQMNRVWSDECTSCLKCTAVCPEKDCLTIQTVLIDKIVTDKIFVLGVIGTFIAVTGLAMLTGNWQNMIPGEEYLQRFQDINAPIYQHHRGRVPQ